MSLDTLRAKITDMFQTAQATSAYVGEKVRIPNLAFDTPTESPYFAIYVVPVTSAKASIGTSASFRKHTALVSIEVYVPENKGTKLLLDRMQWVGDVFQEKVFTLADGETVSMGTASFKDNGLQYGVWRGTVIIKADRRGCAS